MLTIWQSYLYKQLAVVVDESYSGHNNHIYLCPEMEAEAQHNQKMSTAFHFYNKETRHELKILVEE